MVSSFITKISLAIGLLCLVFVIGIWILTNPPKPPQIAQTWEKQTGVFG